MSQKDRLAIGEKYKKEEEAKNMNIMVTMNIEEDKICAGFLSLKSGDAKSLVFSLRVTSIPLRFCSLLLGFLIRLCIDRIC
ncbi:unnamed protein product [Lactuca virosa]|uniref:Uncharacterized protein n=1 Tax=Lactuca virosa TaxID=75947 RepID=A0AAU9PY07_9ASTR|nr:unnamed protein product [Lactuca virosa]